MELFLLKIPIMLVPGLMAITVHEASHGFVADYFGDKTARMMGRLTLNPLKHLDIIGTLMLFLVHFGWAKPVPVNYQNLRHPKRDMIWIAVAGPVSNFILAGLSAVSLRALLAFSSSQHAAVVIDFIEPLVLMLSFSVYINLLLAIFNLIPIPPLDGGRVAVGILPYRQAVAYSKIEPLGFFIVILLVVGTDLFQIVILPVLLGGIHLLMGSQEVMVHTTLNLLSNLPSFLDALKTAFH
jgi:Zn-dependent protease